MPVDVVQADEQAAQPQRNQPDGIQRGDLYTVTDKRHYSAHRDGVNQHGKTRRGGAQTTNRAPTPATQPLSAL